MPTGSGIDLLSRVASGAISATAAVDQVRGVVPIAHACLRSDDVAAEHDWSAASWVDYLYPGTNVLINRLDIHGSGRLVDMEGILVAVRTVEVMTAGIKPGLPDGGHLCDLHRQLAQDVYAWAGQYRSLGKQWSQFAPLWNG